MKKLLAAIAVSAAFAAPAYAVDLKDAEYQITIPSTGSMCASPAFDLPDPSYNCYYVGLGEFTDKLDFSISDPTHVGTFEVVAAPSYRFTVQSGRAHPTYTFSTTLTNVYVVDLGTGNIVAQATNAPFWAHPQCRVGFTNYCSPHQTDDWFASTALPVGNYSLVINGVVSGNRPGGYKFTVQ